MITLKELRWGNAFSYGLDNVVNFINSPLIQLVGKNGHGKSSIALILEEVLFNKNSKGIKKADILNRYVTDSQYYIELDFDKDGVEYTIKVKRSNTQTVKLFKNGTDISAHTATATYKAINDLIELDHKTFTQIVYQSSSASLEFLTATDSNRKKFLIELLNLNKYSNAAEVFKEAAAELNKDSNTLQAKVDTLTAWLNKYASTDLVMQELVDLPDLPDTLLENKSVLQQQLATLDSINKKIAKNNKYKELQAELVLLPIPEAPSRSIESIKIEHATTKASLDTATAYLAKVKALNSSCPTCMQDIDIETVSVIIKDTSAKIDQYKDALSKLKLEHATNKEIFDKISALEKSHQDWEKYHALIDTTIDSTLLDKQNLEDQLSAVSEEIDSIRAEITKCEAVNKKVASHNSKVETISAQLDEFEAELSEHLAKLEVITDKLNTINILNKVFSNNGLVAYKIECLVKDLESITNEYLVDLSDGRFQIAFKVSASDKLNVIITDNGVDIDIQALSNGERARVNVATLLAIRKLMQSLSSSRINLLILDETIESLDMDGKEKLIEILLKEESLNTFLVSHGFSHPLLEKLNVIKEHNISRIEV